MRRNTKYTFMNGILVGLLSCLIVATAQAAPLWTMTPSPGSNPTQNVPENGTATVHYMVQNQSGKLKNLVMQPIAGVVQTTPCQLAPKGQAGSSCTLSLAIVGNALPKNGVHGGPVLCQASPEGRPNPNQCYQPSSANSLHLNVTMSSQPQINIIAPAQQDQIVPVLATSLSLIIMNSAASVVNASGITVSNKAACPNLSVDASDCASVAPGSSCTLKLTSATPYTPCPITISGNNTANSPQTLIAFSYHGGLVFFKEVDGSGKVVADVGQEFNSPWTGPFTGDIGVTSVENGSANTAYIVLIVAQLAAAGGQVLPCAACQCANLSGGPWYLPARDELLSVYGALCSNAVCNFGQFSSANYWSSSQTDSDSSLAWTVLFSSGSLTGTSKSIAQPVRCIQAFNS